VVPRITKRISSAALLIATVFLGVALDYELLLTIVVFMGAIVVLRQAVTEREYFWAAGFAAIALIFNPDATLFQVLGDWFCLTALACTAVFAISLIAMKARPVHSIASITGRNSGGQSP
jgi:hypothetical protein